MQKQSIKRSLMCNNESSFIKTLEIILEIWYNNNISFKVSKKEIIVYQSIHSVYGFNL